jgi:hypothetical protein
VPVPVVPLLVAVDRQRPRQPAATRVARLARESREPVELEFGELDLRVTGRDLRQPPGCVVAVAFELDPSTRLRAAPG